jgi:hypothetical protein
MNALKEPERITLVEGLELLQSHLPAEEAKSRLRQAFIRKAFRQAPDFAFPYDEADIDWTTGAVKIRRKRDRFCPTFSRTEFNAYFGIDIDLKEAPAPHDRSKVFVVHGHDEGTLQAMARFLGTIGLQAIVLREQPDQGLTTIEKFEACASEVGFAVALLTPDDLGGPVAAPEQAARARQNVIFELGYFVGSLGRGRACLLRKGEVEIPSDLVGVIYTDMDHPAEGWKVKLARELRAAGFEFDADKVLA